MRYIECGTETTGTLGVQMAILTDEEVAIHLEKCLRALNLNTLLRVVRHVSRLLAERENESLAVYYCFILLVELCSSVETEDLTHLRFDEIKTFGFTLELPVDVLSGISIP